MGFADQLTHGPLDASAIHLCVDMQNLFREETPWKTPWMARVSPVVATIARQHAASTVFTRFIPARNPDAAVGVWRRYWERWSMLTLERIDPRLVQLIPELAGLSPPAEIFDKRGYSPWGDGRLHGRLQKRGCGALVVTGGETDVCVLATVLGAVDLGYRVVVVADALCSVSDETHDAVLGVYSRRFGQQIEIVSAEHLLEEWRP